MTEHHLRIPLLDPDTDALGAALAYASAGWYVLPVKRGTKNPGSVLGPHWPRQSTRDPQVITSWWAGTDHGIALHVGRSGAVVFDVDHPDQVPEILSDSFTRDCPPHQSTRPDQPLRGHYVYRVPPGRTLGNGRGNLGAGWGEVRGRNGVIVVAPSHHPGGGRYEWLTTGEVPELPAQLAEQLPDTPDVADAATDAEVRAFCARHTDAKAPQLLGAALRRFHRDAKTGSRHEAAVTAACWIAREARAGVYPARDAFRALADAFCQVMAEPRPGGRCLPEAFARAEFAGIAAWAVAQAATADLAKVRRSVEHRVPGWDAPPPEPPCDPEPEEPERAPDGPVIPLEPEPLSMPLEHVPPLIRAVMDTISAHTQTSPELAFLAALAAVSAHVAGGAIADLGWVEPLSLYVMGVADPSDRKSSVLSLAATNPLRDSMAQVGADMLRDIVRAQAARDAAAANAARVEKAIANGQAGPSELTVARLELAQLADVPIAPSYLSTEGTLAGLEAKMAAQNGVCAVFAAEGGLLQSLGGRYSDGRAECASLNSAWSREVISTTRVKGNRVIMHPHATICLLVQPSVLHELTSNKHFAGSGFTARWIYAQPRSLAGYRSPDVTPLDDHVMAQWRQRLLAILRRFWGNQATPVELRADIGAARINRELGIHIEDLLRDPALGDQERHWLGKARGLIGRIAALFELAEDPGAEVITEHNMARAAGLWDWIWAETCQAFGSSADHHGIDREAGREVVKWAARGTAKDPDRWRRGFTVRDLLRSGPRRYKELRAETVELQLEAFAAAGWLRRERPVSKGPGRPQSSRWVVDEGLLDRYAPAATKRRQNGDKTLFVASFVASPDQGKGGSVDFVASADTSVHTLSKDIYISAHTSGMTSANGHTPATAPADDPTDRPNFVATPPNPATQTTKPQAHHQATTHGDDWVLAHLTTTPTPVGAIADQLNADVWHVQAALKRLHAAGRATYHPPTDGPPQWSLTTT